MLQYQKFWNILFFLLESDAPLPLLEESSLPKEEVDISTSQSAASKGIYYRNPN